MGGKTWSKDEERFFWQVIVPQSPKAVRRSDRASDWEECAQLMQREMGPNARRIYTKLMLFEHYFQNVKTGHKSPCAKEFVSVHKQELDTETAGKKTREERSGAPFCEVTSSDGVDSVATSASVPITPASTSPIANYPYGINGTIPPHQTMNPFVSAWDGPNRHPLGGRILPATTGRSAGSLKRSAPPLPLETMSTAKRLRLNMERRSIYGTGHQLFKKPQAQTDTGHSRVGHVATHLPGLDHNKIPRSGSLFPGSNSFFPEMDAMNSSIEPAVKPLFGNPFSNPSRAPAAETKAVSAEPGKRDESCGAESRDAEPAPQQTDVEHAIVA